MSTIDGPEDELQAVEPGDEPDESTIFLYTNQITLGGTQTDLNLQLGVLSPGGGGRVRVPAVVQMSWEQALVLRDLLTKGIAEYETAWGRVRDVTRGGALLQGTVRGQPTQAEEQRPADETTAPDSGHSEPNPQPE